MMCRWSAQIWRRREYGTDNTGRGGRTGGKWPGISLEVNILKGRARLEVLAVHSEVEPVVR